VTIFHWDQIVDVTPMNVTLIYWIKKTIELNLNRIFKKKKKRDTDTTLQG